MDGYPTTTTRPAREGPVRVAVTAVGVLMGSVLHHLVRLLLGVAGPATGRTRSGARAYPIGGAATVAPGPVRGRPAARPTTR